MRPLEGLRILDFTHVLAGPFCTRLLADLGADVIKVNSRKRVGANGPGSPYYVIWNRNKRAIALDMQTEEALEIAKRLANQADVVIDNFSLGVLDRWGIGFDAIHPTNKKVIYVQMSGMGAGGPWSNYVTYAPTIHALAGLTHTNGIANRNPIGIGFSYNDHQAGLHAAVAVLTAIETRRETGEGQQIDLAQFEVGAAMVGTSLLDYFVNGKVAQPSGNTPPYDQFAPHGCYQCLADGEDILDERWLAIVCRDADEWQGLCEVMERPAWCAEERFATAEARCVHAEQLDEYISAWVHDKDALELMNKLQAAGVPAGLVQTGIDLVENDPQLRASGFLQLCSDLHPTLGPTFMDRLPLHFSKTPCDVYERSKILGEDNAAVLSEWLGMTEAEVQEGEETGVLT